jgi:hypothetical protein
MLGQFCAVVEPGVEDIMRFERLPAFVPCWTPENSLLWAQNFAVIGFEKSLLTSGLLSGENDLSIHIFRFFSPKPAQIGRISREFSLLGMPLNRSLPVFA